MAQTTGKREKPFFIIGSERSGTTLLMVMLGTHPRLAVPEVTWYYPRFRPYLHTYGPLSDERNFRTLVEEMVHGLKTPYSGLAVNPRTVVDETLAFCKERSFAGAVDAILSHFAAAKGKPRWGEKTPHNLYYVHEILEDFPDAQFVHINRDGRDVVVEQIDSAFGPTNVYAGAKIWKRCARTAAPLKKGGVPASQFLDVHYEQLVHEPTTVLQRVCEFLGEDYSDDMLNFHGQEIAQRRAKTKDHKPLGDPVNARHVGKYKQLMSVRDQQVFAAVAGDELRSLGYEVGVEPLAVSPEQAALYDEWDCRVRAATMDAPEGHIVYESYNDWLADR
ncbi:MAG TPA: sulfotransferase, partial [Tepidisphaeraceae bacterium]|nr:sulfotransferase [Tepidisphaeraceae bacterium]